MKLIVKPGETQALAEAANPADTTYLVPAFSGLGAPHFDNRTKATITGMTRVTGKNEVVHATVDSIAYQIADVVTAMGKASGIDIGELRVDGGPTRNTYLMQFQSDILNIPVRIPDSEELSGIGAAYAAGLAVGIFDESVFSVLKRTSYEPQINAFERESKYAGWQEAVSRTRSR